MDKGILLKGNIKEGIYKLIKTTNGWVLEGENIAYAGFDVDDTPKVNAELRADFLKRQYKAALKEIEKLKADRPQGEWIEGRYVDPEWISPTADFYKCSICGKMVNLFQMRSYRFCPCCGSKMLVKSGENHE